MSIEMPIYDEKTGGKALVAVEGECRDCCLYGFNSMSFCCYKRFACEPGTRQDGKNVIFKLVDIPAGVKI